MWSGLGIGAVFSVRVLSVIGRERYAVRCAREMREYRGQGVATCADGARYGFGAGA